MTRLHVVLDEMVAPNDPATARQVQAVTAALIDLAAPGDDVAGIVAASPESERQRIIEVLPGLAELTPTLLPRREQRVAWRYGLARLAPRAVVHSPTLYGPLVRHDRLNLDQQVSTTIPHALAFTDPDLLDGSEANRLRAFAQRAVRFADAVVVPTHAVADALAAHLNLGGRVRVISPGVTQWDDVNHRSDVDETDAPPAVTVYDGHPGTLDSLLVAWAQADDAPPLTVLARTPEHAAAVVARLDETALDRVSVRHVDHDEELATLARAQVYLEAHPADVMPTDALQAMALGTPVVYRALPSAVETLGDTGVAIPLDADPAEFPLTAARLIAATDDLEALAVAGQDRARAFTWRGTADKIWQLHAGL